MELIVLFEPLKIFLLTLHLSITLPYNNINAVEEAYEKYPEDIAAIVLEPIPASMGIILPEDNYLGRIVAGIRISQ